MEQKKNKDAFYFPHDYNAHNDPKLVKLAMKGWDLIGLYWALIEILHEQGGYLDYDIDSIAFALHTECDRIANLLDTPGLFETKDNIITSKRVLINLQRREEVSNKARKSAYRRWDNATAMRPQCEPNAIKERKGKERKDIGEPKPPTLKEIENYCKERKSPVNPKTFFDYFNEGNWIDSKGNKVKSWKQKVITWENREKNQNRPTKPGAIEWNTH
jgi:hypothetical protein